MATGWSVGVGGDGRVGRGGAAGAGPSPAWAYARSVFGPGVAAVRRYWRAVALLQFTALVAVVGYGRLPAATAALDRMAAAKRQAGLGFSAVAAAAAGALLPEVAKAVLGDRVVDRRRVRNVGFALATFAVNGVVTDLRFRGMAAVFGDDGGMATVLRKVAVDQFVTTPLYSTPYWLVAYAWRADRYRPLATLRRLTPAWYARSVPPLLVTGWAFWVPMTLLIYALPVPLQFCLFLLAAAAWSLLMVAVAGGGEPAAA